MECTIEFSQYTIVFMILTELQRVKRIQRKYYPSMSTGELIGLLAWWWKTTPRVIRSKFEQQKPRS